MATTNKLATLLESTQLLWLPFTADPELSSYSAVHAKHHNTDIIGTGCYHNSLSLQGECGRQAPLPLNEVPPLGSLIINLFP